MTLTPTTPKWPEDRMDVISQNGNDGQHYGASTTACDDQLAYAPEDVAFKKSDAALSAHYQRVYKGILLDPYRIAKTWGMQGGPREQIMKKCLRFTDKGQTEQQVVDEIRSALNRWQEMLDEDMK